eukprot:TRINITY_DN16383_c0_g1_i1.p1 TRINITY_DN16383_c0_g1~~TRINITY_DN16383_c0_g1_i1.p1  ORF type:complete len:122 (-),score=6.78 TRINITY_DN16383_c0_g1_i1:78-443(-)
MLLDGMMAVTTQHLISSMVRIYKISRPKYANYLLYIRRSVSPVLLDRLSKVLEDEKTSEIGSSSFSAFQNAKCGKIIRSTSAIDSLSLLSMLDSVSYRRKWVYTVLFFILPLDRRNPLTKL